MGEGRVRGEDVFPSGTFHAPLIRTFGAPSPDGASQKCREGAATRGGRRKGCSVVFRSIKMNRKIIRETTARRWFKSRARSLRKDQTEAERRLWTLLRSRRLAGHKFRRQIVLGPFIVDFCCFEERLIVELDGGQHALRKVKDDARTAELKDRGFRVLRFWDDDVLKNTEVVLGAIWKALKDGPPHLPFGHPLPPASRGEREQRERERL